jgi:hypothetical protein
MPAKAWWSRWFGARAVAQPIAAVAAVPMFWREAADPPMPDWDALHAAAPAHADPAAIDAYWTSVAAQWLDRLGASLGGDLARHASPNFELLTALDAGPSKAALSFLEATRKRILRLLDGVAAPAGHGPMIVILLDDPRYLRFVEPFYPEQGVFSESAGMFVHDGYGFFVARGEHLDHVEHTLVHEMAHGLVSHLPLPAWLNEGIAVNTEARHAGGRFSPPDAPWSPEETRARHRAHWTAQTIQRFWAGKSFIDAGIAQPLSYDLAMHMVQLACVDWPRFARFAVEASMDDAGAASARSNLGHPVENLATALLGDGAWAPDPAAWREGVEVGRFRRRR